MKVGDLVKRKHRWMRKKSSNPGISYTEIALLVVEVHPIAIKVMLPDGKFKSDLAEYWEIVNESA